MPNKHKMFLFILATLSNFTFFGIENRRFRSGALDLMDRLIIIPNLDSVYFFTFSHTTPFYSHLHKNIKMEFLTSDVYELKY